MSTCVLTVTAEFPCDDDLTASAMRGQGGSCPRRVRLSLCVSPLSAAPELIPRSYGKILLRDHHQFEDMRSVVALHSDYVFAESFVNGARQGRV
jgi:hypothetical protein